ncbi:MAG: hypothetical protein P8J37_11405 [Fuerstiella sp.]|nr:hypothetical protein [Fuerstiella sp.]
MQSRRPLPDVNFTNRASAKVMPFYDDATVVNDQDLAAVLSKVLPRFSREELRPNYVEHALRIWGAKIEFDNPDLISGPQMAEYLVNTGQYLASWGPDTKPILEPETDGVRIRWGSDATASVHHDHMLASMAEAGITLDTPVFTSARQTTMQQILSEALRDFQLDERETEWSAMAFGLYLAPQQTASWHNSQGRRITFDMLAARLMRKHRKKGVCLGTHRVYSLMALLRLSDDNGGDLLTASTRDKVMELLHGAKERMIASQDADGSWPPNWHEGADAAANNDPNELMYRRVIATGHHLEWLAIAPQELHPPHENIVKAAKWLVKNTLETPQNQIDSSYTFYSHVGNALALWRKTSVPDFWTTWRDTHSPPTQNCRLRPQKTPRQPPPKTTAEPSLVWTRRFTGNDPVIS